MATTCEKCVFYSVCGKDKKPCREYQTRANRINSLGFREEEWDIFSSEWSKATEIIREKG